MSKWPATKANRVLAALQDLGWQVKHQASAHKTLTRAGYVDFVFVFALHDGEEIGPKMLARIARRLTVFPRALAGVVQYFEDEVAKRPNPGQRPGGVPQCSATLEKLDGSGYSLLWRKSLVNGVAPVSALVSDWDGSFVTFDNWHSKGYGEDTVVIYDGSGSIVRKFALTDLMSKKEFDALFRTVSSIWWSGEHRLIDGSPDATLELSVVRGNDGNAKERQYRTIRIRLRDGDVLK